MEGLPRNKIVVKLSDGPCAGTYASVLGFGDECYQRLSRKEQVWCKYVKNLFRRSEYVWSGEAVTTHELQARVAADKNTYGSSEGA